jgi:hypothetical protein
VAWHALEGQLLRDLTEMQAAKVAGIEARNSSAKDAAAAQQQADADADAEMAALQQAKQLAVESKISADRAAAAERSAAEARAMEMVTKIRAETWQHHRALADAEVAAASGAEAAALELHAERQAPRAAMATKEAAAKGKPAHPGRHRRRDRGPYGEVQV